MAPSIGWTPACGSAPWGSRKSARCATPTKRWPSPGTRSSSTTTRASRGPTGSSASGATRRRGHATEILRQSLVIARAEGIDDVLVTCDVANVGSRTAIERCGGVFESIVHDEREGVDKRRYWIR